MSVDALARLRGSLTLAVLIAALAAATAAETGAPAVVRLPLALLATLVLPGMALAAVCFPRIEELSRAERGGLAVALSLALVVVTALLLSYTPWGLTFQPMVWGLTATTVGLSVVGIARQRSLAGIPSLPPLAFAGETLTGDPAQPRTSRLALLGIAAVFAILAGALLTLRLEPKAPAAQFYVLGPNGLIQDYPVNVSPGKPFLLTANLDDASAGTYTVTAVHAGAVLAQASASLNAGQLWRPQLSIILPAGDDQRV
ncbi:MAG: DUF1616 domain-containing protein, partial [Chloroflexi bacterium]|nr:DUF1616 domain-containing protein [Chloroflexota bacterium]